ncbi:MAG: hypothetical protein EAZ44_07150 [Cytophagia bacterium]|nr:MAG: hypothetical protein EAZ44_07150 [Cytophagia bacterium]
MKIFIFFLCIINIPFIYSQNNFNVANFTVSGKTYKCIKATKNTKRVYNVQNTDILGTSGNQHGCVMARIPKILIINKIKECISVSRRNQLSLAWNGNITFTIFPNGIIHSIVFTVANNSLLTQIEIALLDDKLKEIIFPQSLLCNDANYLVGFGHLEFNF